MNPITITEEQKEKLLEMAKALFPEPHNQALKEGLKFYGSQEELDVNYCGFYLSGDNCIQCSFPIDERDDSFHEHLIEPIHWFEFSIYHLAYKILHKKNEYNTELCWIDALQADHPIDYLYEQFKKL